MRKGFLLFGALLACCGSAAAQEQSPSSTIVLVQYADAPPLALNGCGNNSCGLNSWANAEALLLWVSHVSLPPTLTSFAPGSPSATTGTGGLLGVPGTTVVSPDHLGYGMFSGARLTFGTWLDPEQVFGVEANGFFLTSQSSGYGVQSNGTPPLRIPFFNPPPGAVFPPGNTSFFLADPGFAKGGQAINTSLHFWGAEGNALFQPINDGRTKVSMLVGFRYIDLQENMDIVNNESTVGFGAFSYAAFDNFATRNQFYGGQLGLKAQRQFGRFDGTIIAKVALGDMHETVRIGGTSVSNIPPIAGIPTFGGIYAEPSNIGTHERNRFCVAPDMQMQVGMQVTSRIRAFAGYQVLYLSNVVRPGNQVDTTINFTQSTGVNVNPNATLVGTPRPTTLFNSSDFWAHGINVGFSFSF